DALSKPGRGTGETTGSASTPPCASSRSSSVGSGAGTILRMSWTCCSTLFTEALPDGGGGDGGRCSPSTGESSHVPLSSRGVPTDEVTQPGQQFVGKIRTAKGEVEERADVVGLVPGVVAAAAEEDPVHHTAVLGVAAGHLEQGVGQLDLPTAAGWGLVQHGKDLRITHVASDEIGRASCRAREHTSARR